MAMLKKVCVRVFYYQALCLNTGKEVHQGFQSLLSEVNKSDTQYLLRTANRLFGEKTCEFLPVSNTRTLMKKKLKIKQKLQGTRDKVYSANVLKMYLELHLYNDNFEFYDCF